MQRNRTIVGSPVRSASQAWATVTQLLAETLECSMAVADGSVSASLSKVSGIGAALIAGGHLDKTPLVLVDEQMYLSVRVVRGDQVFSVEENLDPVPGGSSATSKWRLYIPAPAHLEGALKMAANGNEHVDTDPAPAYQGDSRTAKTLQTQAGIDRSALRALGGL